MEIVSEKIKFKKYASYKYSGIEWIGEIPNDWIVVSNRALFTERNDAGNESLPLLSVSIHTAVSSEELSEEENIQGRNRIADKSNYKLVQPNDIVFNMMRAWQGAIGAVSIPGMVSPAYIVAKPNSKIHSGFFEYQYRTVAFIQQIDKNSKGITDFRKRLYWQEFKNLITILPSIEEQITIASFLDRKTAQIEKAISIKQKQIELLKERRQILIHHAVTRGLDPNVKMKDSGVEWIGEIPEHWGIKKLKYVTKLVSIKTLSKESPLPYIGMENIESWTGNYISSNSETEGLASYFKEGDILFGKLRPYLAKVYLAGCEGICSTEFLVYRTNEVISNRYMQLLMLSFEFINLVDSSTYGSKMPRASSDFIGNQLIAVPPKSEQFEIVGYITSVTERIVSAVSCKENEIEKLKEYKTTLINSAVTGKIKVS